MKKPAKCKSDVHTKSFVPRAGKKKHVFCMGPPSIFISIICCYLCGKRKTHSVNISIVDLLRFMRYSSLTDGRTDARMGSQRNISNRVPLVACWLVVKKNLKPSFIYKLKVISPLIL